MRHQQGKGAGRVLIRGEAAAWARPRSFWGQFRRTVRAVAPQTGWAGNKRLGMVSPIEKQLPHYGERDGGQEELVTQLGLGKQEDRVEAKDGFRVCSRDAERWGKDQASDCESGRIFWMFSLR